jgi:hypothetical protein
MDKERYADGYQSFWEGRSQRHGTELFGVPHSYIQRRLYCHLDRPLSNKAWQTVYSKDQEKGPVTRIMELYIYGLEMDYVFRNRMQQNVNKANRTRLVQSLTQ